ncbi:hypothetical protein [Streptomyces luteogriseus]|uniref:hypothetical protein n=1 Tax=Streptomyces luteogriseus TaxID=68233 RepID=UPI0037941A24
MTVTTTATARVHWHAFAYTGKGYTDGEVAKGLAPPNFPPTELVRWRDRRPGVRVFKEDEIEDAVAWLDQELNEHVPVDAEAFPIPVRLAYSSDRLRETANRDVWYGYWSKRGMYVTRVLFACSDTQRQLGCA